MQGFLIAGLLGLILASQAESRRAEIAWRVFAIWNFALGIVDGYPSVKGLVLWAVAQ